MARPRLSNDVKLSKRFIFRLTEDELLLLKNVASLSGKAPGVAVRAKLFKGKFPKPKISKLDLQTYVELKKIGVNINQMTRQANLNRWPDGVKEQLQRLLKQQQFIIDLLLNDSESEDR